MTDYQQFFTHKEWNRQSLSSKIFFRRGFGPYLEHRREKTVVIGFCPKCGNEITSLKDFKSHNQQDRRRINPPCYTDKDELLAVYYNLVNTYLASLPTNLDYMQKGSASIDAFLKEVQTWE